jgi:hypothetical protein
MGALCDPHFPCSHEAAACVRTQIATPGDYTGPPRTALMTELTHVEFEWAKVGSRNWIRFGRIVEQRIIDSQRRCFICAEQRPCVHPVGGQRCLGGCQTRMELRFLAPERTNQAAVNLGKAVGCAGGGKGMNNPQEL